MNHYKQLLGGAAAAVAFALPQPAHAQLTSAGLACTNGGALSFMHAIACSGAWNGNNKNQQSLVFAKMQTDFASYVNASSSPWSYLGDANFSGSTVGVLNLGQTITGYFTIALKASNQFSLYLFDGGVNGVSSLAFETNGASVNRKGIPQGLSHASIYDAVEPPPPPPPPPPVDQDDGGFGSDVISTPEPATAALVVAGLIGIAAVRRRKR